MTEVKHSVDIVALVNESVALKKAGKSFIGLCPFHPDKTPSLHVSTSGKGKYGDYHCYACQVSGDAFDWATKYLHMSFYESVIFLAQRAGIAVPQNPINTAETIKKKKLTTLLQRACLIYQHGLSKSPEQMSMLLTVRKLSIETINKWQLGLVSKGITPFLKADNDSLVESGLVGTSEDGARFERLRMRITIPIHSPGGFLVGFAGRRLDSPVLSNSSAPKYLNPPENQLFSKRNILFGLHHAAQSIRRAQQAIVVEGYFDVIALHQAGETCAVAGMGTAFTSEQFLLLAQYSSRITFCFDGDNAGRRSSALLLNTLLPLLKDGMEVSFIWLPEGSDPDTYISDFGLNQWIGLRDNAMPLSDFILNEISQAQNSNSVEERVKMLMRAREIISMVNAPLFREVLSQAVLARHGVCLSKENDNVSI